MFERRKAELQLHIPPRDAKEASVDYCLWICAEQKRQNQSQSNPTENVDSASPERKCVIFPPPPPTEQSHSQNFGPAAPDCG